MPPARSAETIPAILVQLGALALAFLLLVAVGQPLFTDDAWWHIALGRAYASRGPWLDVDPLLYTAAGPPAPAAWLSDLALFGIDSVAGFAGLRVGHVLAVLAILALVWSTLARAGGSRVLASLGTSAFVALAAYRLIQLRPELFTIFATLALYRLLFERAEVPSWRRVALASALLAVWANAHAGFLLGPIFIASAAAGLVAAQPLRRSEQRSSDRARALRLSLALCAGLAATLFNPSGSDQYLAYFVAGADSPALLRVADEWTRFQPFRLPVPRLPPSPLAWAIVWGLLVTAPAAAGLAIRGWRARPGVRRTRRASVDPALVAITAASLAAMLLAVRFLWLGIFPLLLIAAAHRARQVVPSAPPRATAWGAAAVALLLVPGFLRFGDWPMISRGVSFAAGSYGQPYPASKYYANAVWLLDDAGLAGNLYNDYSLGGFLGYWLAPELRSFVNGSLNVPIEVMNAGNAIRSRRGLAPGETFLELLDRQQVDVFLGTGLARVGPPNRPWHHTTRHLEASPGWILLYRDLSSAVYLRANERNRGNLERAAAYYAALDVPFDPASGFDPVRVIRENPEWATLHGLVPHHFEQLAAMAGSFDPSARASARSRLAALYAALGLYDRSIPLDRSALVAAPEDTQARQRLAWALLRLGRSADALAAVAPLADAPPSDRQSHEFATAVRRYAALDDPEAAASLAASLPLLSREQATDLRRGVAPPKARTHNH